VNVWSHLAVTYDGATLRLYVNGTQVATRAQTGAITSSTNPLRIGGNAVWGEYFNGVIDEVRVYNRALSAAEITTDRDTPVGGGTGAQHLREPPGAGADLLTPRAVAGLVPEVLARWAGLGAPVAALRDRPGEVRIADLPGSNVGFTAGNVIWLDPDAAGHGWFIDPTPADDREFGPVSADGPAAGRADLLTVLAHEIGHLFGLPTTHGSDLMGDDLPLGVRRVYLEQTPAFDLVTADRMHGARGVVNAFSIGASDSTRAQQSRPVSGSGVPDRPPVGGSEMAVEPGYALDLGGGVDDERSDSLSEDRWGILLDRPRPGTITPRSPIFSGRK
jgi:hypothetical protein